MIPIAVQLQRRRQRLRYRVEKNTRFGIADRDGRDQRLRFVVTSFRRLQRGDVSLQFKTMVFGVQRELMRLHSARRVVVAESACGECKNSRGGNESVVGFPPKWPGCQVGY